MAITIALAGNPNSGKTTVFNELTGSTQYVGNWPGVTVEKKDGILKGYQDVIVMDLPGIYSLSPYTLEEMVARDYLIKEKPDVIVNVVDSSNLERNLYLTSQLLELGIPVIIALNMIDIVEKNNDKIDIKGLSKKFGCPVIPTSAIQNQRHEDNAKKRHAHKHYAHGHIIHNSLISSMRGLDAIVSVSISLADKKTILKNEIVFDEKIEKALESISMVLNNDFSYTKYTKRYASIKIFEHDEKVIKSLNIGRGKLLTINSIIKGIEKEKDDDGESVIINERYNNITNILKNIYIRGNNESRNISNKIDKFVTNKFIAIPLFFLVMWFIYWISISVLGEMFIESIEKIFASFSASLNHLLLSLDASPAIISFVINGVVSGLSNVLVFVPQLMILFFFISLLEDCGYMSRVAFIMDRLFRKFGLSGKSVIPLIVGTGCSVPAIMTTRTIESEKDRKMTIMLTPFIPCGAKLPVFAMFATVFFGGAAWIGPSMYLLGILMVFISGLILKNTRLFKGEPSPFVMELPSYKLPRIRGVAIHMWDKGKSFIIKAGTVIFVACAAIWFLQSFSFQFQYLGGQHIELSMLVVIGKFFAPIFAPLGFGNWEATVAIMTGFVAKEIVVATFGIVSTVSEITFTQVSAYAFIVFILLSSPCIAAIDAMRREFKDMRWTITALIYQTSVAYIMALIVNQVGSLLFKTSNEKMIISFNAGISDATQSADSSEALLTFMGILIATGVVTIVVRYFKKKRANRAHRK